MQPNGIGISTIDGGKVLYRETIPKNAAITESAPKVRLLNIRFW